MASIEIAVGHPQRLNQSAFKLKFQDFQPSDEVFIVDAGREQPLNRGALVAPYNTFMKVSPNEADTYLIDFLEAPADVTQINIHVRPYADSYPAWVLTGLRDKSEVWLNQVARASASRSVCVLTFARTSDTENWTVEAKSQASTASLNTTEIPVAGGRRTFPVADLETGIRPELLDEIQIAGERHLPGTAKEFEVIIDISASMRSYLEDEKKVPALLESLQGLSAHINRRPIDVSYGGIINISLTVDDEPSEVHSSVLPQIMSPETQSQADIDGYLGDRFDDAPIGTAFLVVSDALPYLDPDDLLPRLTAKKQQVRVLLLAQPLGGTAIGNDPRLSLQVLDLNEAQLLNQLNPFI